MPPQIEAGHEQITQLLSRWTAGDSEALKSLIPIVYKDLRQLAHKRLRLERHELTLQTTAVVHEGYLRLARHCPRSLRDRKQFFAMASSIIRQVLVDHARERHAQKRDAGIRVELTPELIPVFPQDLNMLALDEALTSLAKLDPRQSRIVELRYFAGLSIEETSEALGMSPATVKRDWLTARAWLQRQMLNQERALGARARSAS
jgi:RNA polymerase sigma factor (TIGR02999 family)